MSKRELVARELDTTPEEDLDVLLELIRAIKVRRAESTAILAESSLSKDWLTAEEEAAWADL